MPTPDDPRDFTDQYNTVLPPEEELKFQAWATSGGKNWKNETYDYDLRGYYLMTDGAPLGEGHLTDQFKKPNHPTFSDESIYHGVDGYYGGHWYDNKTYMPGDTNVYSNQELSDYFAKNEGDSGYTVVPNPLTNPM